MAYHTKQNRRQCTHKNWGDKALIRFLQEGNQYDYEWTKIKIYKNDAVIAGGLDEDDYDIRAIGISAIVNLDLGDEVSSQSKYNRGCLSPISELWISNFGPYIWAAQGSTEKKLGQLRAIFFLKYCSA